MQNKITNISITLEKFILFEILKVLPWVAIDMRVVILMGYYLCIQYYLSAAQ